MGLDPSMGLIHYSMIFTSKDIIACMSSIGWHKLKLDVLTPPSNLSKGDKVFVKTSSKCQQCSDRVMFYLSFSFSFDTFLPFCLWNIANLGESGSCLELEL